MKYEEFNELKQIVDLANPFINLYVLDSGERFYIEPGFYSQMQGFKERFNEGEYLSIVSLIIETAKKNKKVVYTSNYEEPQTAPNEEGFIFLEITDITDRLKLFVEDKSRGSDYGD